jgi:hypothetical protein
MQCLNRSVYIILAPTFFFSFLGLGWDLGPRGTSTTKWPLYQPWMIDDDECGVVGGMRIGRGNRSTRRKPAPVPLCPPQTPHDLTWARTRAAAMKGWRLTAWSMALPSSHLCQSLLRFPDKNSLSFSHFPNAWYILLCSFIAICVYVS